MIPYKLLQDIKDVQMINILHRILKISLLIASSVILYYISRKNYLLFHNIVEMYSIIIAAGIFIVSWNSRNHSENNKLVFLGIAYGFVAFIDFFHVLSYKGMNIFTDYPFYANQLWVCARILESFTLLIFVVSGFRKYKISYPLVIIIYTAITSFFLLSVFIWKIFPVCFIAGEGQTPFKIISEYFICMILLISLILIIRTRYLYDRRLFNQIAGSIIFTIISEFSFTLYTDNYGITNVIGHLFKVLSFYLIYQSVIVNTLKRPFDIIYGELKETKTILQTAMDQSSAGIAIAKAPEGTLQYVNNAGLYIRGGIREDIVDGIGLDQYADSWRMFSLDGTPMKTEEVPLSRAIIFGETNSSEFIIRNNNNDDRIILANAAPIKNDNGDITAGIVIFQDITEIKQAEEKIKKLLNEKELILKEVHHRIKNNMNTIMSFLYIQSSILNDPIAIAALDDSANRIRSMLILYDKLYRSEDFNNIAIDEYLPSLIDEIISNFPNSNYVTVEKKIESFNLNVKKMQPIGIIINELLTNIMKYAFTGKENGFVSVSAALKDNTVKLEVSDNGMGMSESVNSENSTGFGMQLVNMLTDQIGGSIKIERGEGTRFIIEFNL